MGSEIAARNRKSLATFHRTLKSQCSVAFSSLGNRAISGVRDGHRNRKSQKSLRFRCAKHLRIEITVEHRLPCHKQSQRKQKRPAQGLSSFKVTERERERENNCPWPGDPCLSRQVSQGHPASVPCTFLNFGCDLTGRVALSQKSQKIPSFIVKHCHKKHTPKRRAGFFHVSIFSLLSHLCCLLP